MALKKKTFSSIEFYLCFRINNREIVIVQNILDRLKNLDLKDRINFKNDTPIPPGATKFSYSTRLHELWFKFCDTDIDFMDVKVRNCYVMSYLCCLKLLKISIFANRSVEWRATVYLKLMNEWFCNFIYLGLQWMICHR